MRRGGGCRLPPARLGEAGWRPSPGWRHWPGRRGGRGGRDNPGRRAPPREGDRRRVGTGPGGPPRAGRVLRNENAAGGKSEGGRAGPWAFLLCGVKSGRGSWPVDYPQARQPFRGRFPEVRGVRVAGVPSRSRPFALKTPRRRYPQSYPQIVHKAAAGSRADVLFELLSRKPLFTITAGATGSKGWKGGSDVFFLTGRWRIVYNLRVILSWEERRR